MAKMWHVRRNFKDFGPFTGDQVKKLASQGKLNGEDFIWNARPEDGAPARFFVGLSDIITEGQARKSSTATAVATPPAGTPQPRASQVKVSRPVKAPRFSN